MAREIEISVRDRIAWQTNKTEYICGNKDFAVVFDFDSEWENIKAKTARFDYGGENPIDVVFDGNQCNVPRILGASRMNVGVFAGDLQTTTPATVLCKKSILCNGGVPEAPSPDVYAQIMELLKNGVSEEQIAKAVTEYLQKNPIDTGSKLTIGAVELLADKWVGGGNLYSQVVAIDGVTPYSQIDLTPSVEQLAIFHDKDLAFVTENEDGVVTVYAIGDKPLNDYTMQVTIKEVSA